MDDWRSIEDNPPLERHILLATQAGEFTYACVGYYDLDGLCWNCSQTDEPLAATPDYWMDIPPIPKDEE